MVTTCEITSERELF